MIHKGVIRTFFLYAYETATGAPKTGDTANITIYKAEDTEAATQIIDTIAEIDATNMPGWYRVTTTLNGNSVAISAKSATTGIQVTVAGIYLNTGAIPSTNAGQTDGLPIIGASPLSNLDATVSSRVATVDTRLNNLDTTISSRLSEATYTAPDNTSITAIKSQTDKLAFSGIGPYDVKATLDGEAVTVSTNNDKIGYSLTADYDRAKTALSTTEYVSPDNTSIAAIKTQTDKLKFAVDGDVLATLDSELVSLNTDQSGVTIGTVNALGIIAKADVNAEVDTALAEYDAPTYTEMTAAFTEIKGATWTSTDTLENIRNKLDTVSTHSAADVWNAATRTLTAFAFDVTLADSSSDVVIADAVWNAAIISYGTAGTYGEHVEALDTSNLDATISSRLDSVSYTAPDNASIAAIKTKTDQLNFTGTDVVATLDGETVNVGSISGNTNAADNLEIVYGTMISGSVVADVSNTTTSFKISLTESEPVYDGKFLLFAPTASLARECRAIISFNTTTQFVTVDAAYSSVPIGGDTFILLGYAGA